jgi:uncharacterized protein DUF6599
MSRSSSLVFASLLAVVSMAAANDEALWNEYGRVQTDTGTSGTLKYTAYRMKDLTGALAAWEWLRSPAGKSCDQAPFCTQEANRITVLHNNYVVTFDSPAPPKAAVEGVLQGLPGQRDSALPAILTFVPQQGLVPDSARYLLGKASAAEFAGELGSVDPGFAEGAEGQVAAYKLPGSKTPARLAVFYYVSPEAARMHMADFRQIPGVQVKRSGLLLGVVLPGATEQQADTLLSRVEYSAKITWNDPPPPGQIKPLYRLLLNIIYMSVLLSGVCLLGGLIYAGMRIYRRRFGELESQEAMTTLHLSRD